MAIPGNFLSATTESIDPNTSGWAAKLNCSLGLGSGGRNGDGVAKLTATAAGEMQARTYSSYPVTAGDTYWTFADASSTTIPERIGLRWLSSSGAEISITWSLTTTSASSAWHRISVGGQAPAGAAQVQVLISATATAAGQITFFENVYLGYPMRIPGNLLSFDAEQFEISGSSWAAETNGTLSRTVPAVPWAVNWYYAGGEMLTLTATAAGNASAACVERPAVTPGIEYVGQAYLNPPASSSSCWVELRFYDVSGVKLSSARSTLAAPGTSYYRQVVSAVAPAGAATASLAAGINSATAGQAMRVECAFLKARAASTYSDLPNANVVPYADSSFEQGIGQWTVPAGVATIGQSTPWGAQASVDYYSLTVSSATASGSTIRSGIYAVSPGVNWRLKVSMKQVAGAWNAVLTVRWLDASGSLISTDPSTSWAIPSTGPWYLLQHDALAPANAVSAQIDLVVTATSAPSTLQIDNVQLVQVLPQTEVTVDNGSASATLVTREINTALLMTVYRVLANGSRTLLRDATGLTDHLTNTDDTYVVTDYEAPLGVPFSYRIEFYSATTGLLAAYRTTNTYTIDPGDPNYAWLKDPSRPILNRRVLVKQAPEWKQPIDQNVMRPRGRQNAVVLSGVRSGREGDLIVWTQSDDEREALRFLLATGNVLLWQTAPGMGESDVYVSVGETALPRVSTYAHEPWREWTLPLTEVDQPTGGMAGSASWTVRDVALENASALTVVSRYATVLDLALDQRSGS
ncbi:hypothetical protein HZZ00_11255 [Streptomyces sp. NEAU-sy36]|nr:hypothetical protein HZZ00_11255 [Streptomyces sp. NEAU-sy36]